MQKKKLQELYKEIGNTKLLLASKNRSIKDIEQVLHQGHRLFGENRVQESLLKWPKLKDKYSDITLHMIGKLQTNKVKEAAAIFDVIETLDRENLAKTIKKHASDMECYIQVNTGEEEQKSGIYPKHFDDFLYFCTDECGINVTGIMCIPPVDEPSAPHFALLAGIAQKHSLKNVSMGMSRDYSIALKFDSTQIRIGSAFFA